uniref:Uncharacterized protein n=1 Tax=Romanomermis culicivorax TaxID=13658 RepID=A0A915I5C0_ROMCU
MLTQIVGILMHNHAPTDNRVFAHNTYAMIRNINLRHAIAVGDNVAQITDVSHFILRKLSGSKKLPVLFPQPWRPGLYDGSNLTGSDLEDDDHRRAVALPPGRGCLGVSLRIEFSCEFQYEKCCSTSDKRE